MNSCVFAAESMEHLFDDEVKFVNQRQSNRDWRFDARRLDREGPNLLDELGGELLLHVNFHLSGMERRRWAVEIGDFVVSSPFFVCVRAISVN